MIMLFSLSACAPGVGKITAADIRSIAPDVPAVSKSTQLQAAKEVTGGQCPALAHLAAVALQTRDEARALHETK